MHINGVFGNTQMVCDGDNGILQIEDALLIQQGNDFLILIGGRNREVAVNGFFAIFSAFSISSSVFSTKVSEIFSDSVFVMGVKVCMKESRGVFR